MDDIGCFSTTWKEHIAVLKEVLYCLESVRFTNAILCMKPPSNMKQLHAFLGIGQLLQKYVALNKPTYL